jgi:hypothetical protein
MPRTTIAAVVAMLLVLAPAASARPADPGYPAYPTPEVAAKPKVMPERISDHPAPKADAEAAALAQEQYYSTKGNPAVGDLVREQESTSGSGNQAIAPPTDATTRALDQERAYSTYGEVPPIEREPAPATADDDTPWPLIGAGFAGVAMLLGLAALVIARLRRPGVAT